MKDDKASKSELIYNNKLICCGKPVVRKKHPTNGLYQWRCQRCFKYYPDTSSNSPNRKKHYKYQYNFGLCEGDKL